MLIIRTFKRALSLSYVAYSCIHLYINCPVMSVQVIVTHIRRFSYPMPQVSIRARGPLMPEVASATLSLCFTWLGPPSPWASLAHITHVFPSWGPSFSCLGTCVGVSFIPWHVTRDLSHFTSPLSAFCTAGVGEWLQTFGRAATYPNIKGNCIESHAPSFVTPLLPSNLRHPNTGCSDTTNLSSLFYHLTCDAPNTGCSDTT